MHTFQTPGTTRIVIVNPMGDVELADDGDASTSVELIGVGSSGDELVEATSVEHRDAGGVHVVTVTLPTPRSLSRRRDGVDVRISAPRGAHVAVSAHANERSLLSMMRDGSGSVTLHGTFGDLDVALPSTDVCADVVEGSLSIKTASGDVTAKQVDGTVKVRSVSGDVRVTEANGDVSVAVVSGDIEITTANKGIDITSVSGDVSVFDARAGASVKSTSGDVSVHRVWADVVRAATVSGDVLVGVPSGRGINVDARSMSGSLSSEIDLDGTAAPGADSTVVRIKANSVSGDVRIQRAVA